MAAKLQCEICGGKLIGKPGGIFECEYCGTEYSTEWARAKLQEITGTVRIEGPVEVRGQVQVDGPVQVDGTANVESLTKRGFLSLEDKEWDKAKEIFDQVLNMDPESGDAYLGMVMAENKVSNREKLQEAYIDHRIAETSYLRRARQFAEIEDGFWWEKLDADRDAEDERKRLEKAEKIRKDAEEKEQQRIADKKKRRRNVIDLTPIRKELSAAHNMLAVGYEHTVGLKCDGSVIANGNNNYNQCNVSSWKRILAISAGRNYTVGLKYGGTVVATGWGYDRCIAVDSWQDIIAISACDTHTIGLKSDGTVIATGNNEYKQCNVSYWGGIVAVATAREHTVGLRADGTVVATGDKYDRCNVSSWKDVVAIAVSDTYTVGLLADGTVVTTNPRLQEIISEWRDIVAITAGVGIIGIREDGAIMTANLPQRLHEIISTWTDIIAVTARYDRIVGLQSDGTVKSTGFDHNYGENALSNWKLFDNYHAFIEEQNKIAVAYQEKKAWHEKIRHEFLSHLAPVQRCSLLFKKTISVNTKHIVGLQNNGNVVARAIDLCKEDQQENNITQWKSIISITAGDDHIVGLQADGKVVAAGSNRYGQCNVGGWRDIVSVVAGYKFTAGLKADGTVMTTDEYSSCISWKDVLLLQADSSYLVGLCADGTVVTTNSALEKKYQNGVM